MPLMVSRLYEQLPRTSSSTPRRDLREQSIAAKKIRATDPLLGETKAYLPLKVSVSYLLGTYLLFLIGPFLGQANNVFLLTLFIFSATILFALGYHLSVMQSRSYQLFRTDRQFVTPQIRLAVIASSIWFLVFSFASLGEYGATGIGDIVKAAVNPSASYFAKFDIYAAQTASGRISLPIQLTVLTGALYGAMIPLAVYFWHGLGLAVRLLVIVSALSYLSYFVYIGTQKGVGDLLVMGLAALAVSVAGRPDRTSSSGSATKRSLTLNTKFGVGFACIALGLGFVGYMANNQGDRLQGLSIEGQFVPDPFVSSLLGEKFARGLAATSYYPTNGYIGLSHNLGVPFEWAGGLGGAPALASYKTQYLGGEDPMELSYPVRTEAATGWPAGLLWATIYPWLASDLTFPGAALFMALVGWFMARTWLGARVERDALSLILFCQMSLFIAYVPANNQLMTSRYTAVGIISLLGMYVLRRATKRRDAPSHLILRAPRTHE